MEIGNKIKKLRELRNFTQEFMAQNLEMTTSGYGKIERNETEVSYQKLEKIAEVLGLKIEDIINFNEQVVFHQLHNNYATAGYIINQTMNDKERSLYEQIIAQQKEEIDNLREIIRNIHTK